MYITKWLQNDDGDIKKVQWQVIKTDDSDKRGYSIEGIQGKWLTIVSTFEDDSNINIISINPFENPSLEKYTELSEEEAKQKLDEIEYGKKEEERLQKIESDKIELNRTISYKETIIAKQQKILDAVKDNILYNGDLELMTALHDFTEDSLTELKSGLEEDKNKLLELENE